MKSKRVLSMLGVASGSILLATTVAHAATNYMIDTYPQSTGATDVTYWQQCWGSAPFTVTFDPLVDVINDTNNSGSVRFDVDFSNTAGSDLCMGRPLDGLTWAWNGAFLANPSSLYGSLEFDILWSTNSAMDDNHTWAKFNNMPVDGAGNWEWNNAGYYVVTNNPGVWQHVKHTFPLTFNPSSFYAWAFYLYEANGPGGENHIRGPVTFWLDNVMFATNYVPPPPPPTMAIRHFSGPHGLQMCASSYLSASQRQNIRTINSFPWISSPDPVTYSMTITNFPDAAHAGFEAHMFLVSGTPGNESAADHNEPNVVYVQVLNDTNGNATANFMYKTNNPGSSGGGTYNPNIIGTITNTTALGTWSVTFTGDTGVKLTAPSGSSTNFTMDADSAALFGGSLYVYYGIMPNSTNNSGQAAIFSNVEIRAGTTTNVSDSFLTFPLNTDNWTVLADTAAGVFVLPPESAYWITWTIPDTDFQFQTTTNVADTGSWVTPLPAVLFQNNANKTALMTNEPSMNSSYFRLLKPGS